MLGWSGERLGSSASTLGGHKDAAEDGRGVGAAALHGGHAPI
jgi:hypothetical protein